jgi:hypothetical protein
LVGYSHSGREHDPNRWSVFSVDNSATATIRHNQNRRSDLQRITSHGRIRNARAGIGCCDSVYSGLTNAISGKAVQLGDARGLLQLVQKAAGVAEQNNKHALGIAQRLSQQLRAPDDRIAELEAWAAACQQQSRACGTVAAPSVHRDRGPLFASRCASTAIK